MGKDLELAEDNGEAGVEGRAEGRLHPEGEETVESGEVCRGLNTTDTAGMTLAALKEGFEGAEPTVRIGGDEEEGCGVGGEVCGRERFRHAAYVAGEQPPCVMAGLEPITEELVCGGWEVGSLAGLEQRQRVVVGRRRGRARRGGFGWTRSGRRGGSVGGVGWTWRSHRGG